MTRAWRWVLSMLLWTWGGAVYFILEVVYKTATGHPERISWTMLVLAIILCIPIERCGAELPWRCPLWVQATACAALVTAVELVAGLMLNVWMGLDIWDYSSLPLNFMGQICPQFAAVWWGLCLAFIPIFDWMRYIIQGGERPRYYWKLQKEGSGEHDGG